MSADTCKTATNGIQKVVGKTSQIVADELTENGHMLRYRTHEAGDGLSGEDGTFLICSFWLVSAFGHHR
jgi:GH15 family glucan-1,4-alpha-glucosidase